ncbi:hypothetical protein BJ742DRAFT_819596 [Cladochytrium replicatum]|nr:hypothetical protein BJ742DRAFT_819596 [Cladochytrium replicatum]
MCTLVFTKAFFSSAQPGVVAVTLADPTGLPVASTSKISIIRTAPLAAYTTALARKASGLAASAIRLESDNVTVTVSQDDEMGLTLAVVKAVAIAEPEQVTDPAEGTENGTGDEFASRSPKGETPVMSDSEK